jgi:hypothetical protein
MKRFLVVGAVIAALLAVLPALGGVGVASASVAPDTYRMSYYNPPFGYVQCAGVHLDIAAAPKGMDQWYATFTNYIKPGTTFTQKDFTWYSDYYLGPQLTGDWVPATSFKITVLANGHSMLGWAQY